MAQTTPITQLTPEQVANAIPTPQDYGFIHSALTVSQTAIRLGVGRQTVRNLIANGTFRAKVHGGHYIISLASIEAYERF